MRPLILDTNAYTAFKRGDKAVNAIVQRVEKIAMSTIVLGELLSGFDNGSKSSQNRQELNEFLESSRIRIYPVTLDTANFYSHVYLSLKRKGKPISTNDMWIAAQALEHGCMVCTFDQHFNAIEGLVIGLTVADLLL